MRNGPELKQKPTWQSGGEDRAAEPDPDEPPRPLSTRGVLSPEEIEALLRPKPQIGALETPDIDPQSITPRAVADFDGDEVRVTPVEDPEQQKMAARLSRALGAGAGIKAAINVSGSATIARGDLPGLLNGKSSAIACLGATETDIEALVCLPPALADAIIAKACGARGSTGRIGDGWTLSAIDCALLEQLLTGFGAALGSGLRLQGIETDIPYVSSLLPAKDVTITEFTVEAPGLHSEIAVIQSQPLVSTEPLPASGSGSAPITAIATARLASLTVPLSRITALKAGSTLLLGLPPDQPVELLSGGRDGEPAYEGRMGRKGNKVALQITKKRRTFDPKV